MIYVCRVLYLPLDNDRYLRLSEKDQIIAEQMATSKSTIDWKNSFSTIRDHFRPSSSGQNSSEVPWFVNRQSPNFQRMTGQKNAQKSASTHGLNTNGNGVYRHHHPKSEGVREMR